MSNARQREDMFARIKVRRSCWRTNERSENEALDDAPIKFRTSIGSHIPPGGARAAEQVNDENDRPLVGNSQDPDQRVNSSESARVML